MAQIGTIKLETGSGPVEVPVFDTGDSGSDVYEFVRVQTSSGTGFIPVVEPADASFPYLRVQSQNQGIVAVHNEATLVQEEIVDDFEDGDLSEYSGPTSNYTIVTSPVKVGSRALEVDDDTTNTTIESTSGLNYYPKRGDRITWWTNAETDARPSVGFGDNDTDNIIARHAHREQELQLGVPDGTSTVSVSTSSGVWYFNEVLWSDTGDVTYSLYDDDPENGGTELASVSASESTITAGDPYVRINENSNTVSSNVARWDHIVAYTGGA